MQTLTRQKIMLSLSDDALGVLNTNASERKRGELASKAILAYASKQSGQEQPGILERIEARLAKIEAMLAEKECRG